MDPVTHAASGALLALALPVRARSRWLVPLAALAANAPDLDIFLGSTPEAFLALHRGVTHSLILLPLFALLLVPACAPLWRPRAPGSLSPPACWLLCVACLALHVWLDCITTFGTMPFLPFSGERVRLNAAFIADPLLTVPALLALIPAARRARHARLAAGLGLAWLVAWPLMAMGANHLHGQSQLAALTAEGRAVRAAVVLPDIGSPLRSRLLFEETTPSGAIVRDRAMGPGGETLAELDALPALDRKLARGLAIQSAACARFLDFTILPVALPLPSAELAGSGLAPLELRERGLTPLLVHDLRFGSGVPAMRDLLARRPNAAVPFRLMLVLGPDGAIVLERLAFSDRRVDSGWRAALAARGRGHPLVAPGSQLTRPLAAARPAVYNQPTPPRTPTARTGKPPPSRRHNSPRRPRA